MTKSTSKIKELMSEYDDLWNECDYHETMSYDEDLPKDEREVHEDEAAWLELKLYDIAEEIKELKPSQYMQEKYPDLQDILEWVI